MKSQERRVRGAKLARLGLSIAFGIALAPAAALAGDQAANLGEGLKQLAAPPVAARASARSAASAEPEVKVTSPVQFDDANRALVRISLDGSPAAASTLKSLQRLDGVEVIASDLSYGPGLIEAYVPAEQLLSVAHTKGVMAVVPSSPMVTNVGIANSQGIVQHRVDKLPAGVDGSGITVGVMSDSYDTNAAPNSAALDVASGDLPGVGNPAGNTQPVVVLEDFPARSDEGRAMLQIVHDLAPKAKLGFATANTGELGFANNIRALAGDPTAPNFRAGFKADVIVDDIIYLAEPFFQDGVIAQAVDEVVAKGVSYFSSAGNRPATQAYDSKIRIVPGTPASWASTNLNFSTVDPALYAGGFHNFGGNGSVDIAQTVQFTSNPGSSNTVVLQWNEPYDSKQPTAVGTPFAAGVGTVPDGGSSDFTFSGTAGQAVMIFVDGDTTTTGTSIPDIMLELYSPTNELIATKDTGTNPEFLALALPAAGTYTVRVLSFEPTGGDYQYTVSNAVLPEPVLSDYNLLFFLSTGQYIGGLAEANTLTNRPLEIGGINATVSIQLVIARGNTPTPSRAVADRIRYVAFGNIQPQEYVSYMDPVTYGHNSAAGAIGVAAYPFFAPFVPEAFTSPGPATIYFDKNSKRLRNVDNRQKPDLAAMDGANTTFFTSDTANDDDTLPNFFGTSAAAPHAAAIAALVLDAAGGPGSVKPKKMREILQESAFAHDLDPYFSWGLALSRGNLLAIDATADANSISQFDPNVFTVTHFGTRALANLSINGTGANPTNTPGGIVFDERTTPAPAPGQPFVVGDRTEGLTPLDVQGTFSLPADPPGLAGQWKQLDLKFLPGKFGSGDLLTFGVDRDETDVTGPGGAAGGNSADLLGGGVLIPSGKFVPGGAKFFGKFEGGNPFAGEFLNLIGCGYSPLDGYGFINAEAAVKAVQKKHH